MAGESESLVVAVGVLRTIVYAVTENGKSPAKEFIESLKEKEQHQLAVLFQRMAENGKIFNKEQFKQLEDKIYEFKRHQTRTGCFRDGDHWVLTHGFIKKTDRWPKSELDKAKRIMKEHLDRKAAPGKPGTKGKRK